MGSPRHPGMDRGHRRLRSVAATVVCCSCVFYVSNARALTPSVDAHEKRLSLPSEVDEGGGKVYRVPSNPMQQGKFRFYMPSLAPFLKVPEKTSDSSNEADIDIGIRPADIQSHEVTIGPLSAGAACTWMPGASDTASLAQKPCEPPSTRTWRGLHRSPWFVTLELFAVQTASIFVFAALPKNVSGFSNPKAHNIFHYAAKGPRFDDDRWGFNYIGHPLAGSEYYLLLRNRKGTWWQALLYAAGWSGFWEYVTEGLYEQASIQDLVVTPLAGAALGELRYQLRRALVDLKTSDGRSWPVQLLIIALDPIQAFSEAVPLDFAKASPPSADPSEPCRE